MVDLSQTYSKNNLVVAEYVKTYHTTPVKSAVKTVRQQQKHLTKAETRKIVEKYKAGVSTHELAQEFGCHRYTISNALKRSGVIVDKHVEGREYETEEVIRLYKEEKKSVKQIAEMFDVCDGAIYKCLKRNNVYAGRTRWDYERYSSTSQVYLDNTLAFFLR